MIYKILKFKFIYFLIFLFFIFGSINITEAKESPCNNDTGPCNLRDAFKVKDKKYKDPLDRAAWSSGYNVVTDPDKDIFVQISNTIRSIFIFLGVLFMILMIYGGYIWMFARGNDQEVEKAKNILIAALAGLVVIVMAYAISYFVVEFLSRNTIKQT